jgi:hypothetical protein
MFTLSFGHSASKNYQKAIDIAHDIGGKMDNGNMVITIPDYELLRAYEYVWPLLQIIQNWKTVAGDYNGKKVNPFKFLYPLWRTVGECGAQKNNTWDTRHCWQDNDHRGWGCKHLNSFSAYNYGSGAYQCSNRFWYNFGEFNKRGDEWMINKRLLNEKLDIEAKSKCLALCPFFDMQTVKKIIAELPDGVYVDGVSYAPLRDDFGRKINVRHLQKEEPNRLITIVDDSGFSRN